MADPDLAVVARRRQKRFFVIASPLFVLLVPAMALVSFASTRSMDDLPAGSWIILAASAVPALLVVGALLWARRWGARAVQPPLSWGLSWTERWRISKAIRTNQPVGEHLEVARDMAHRSVSSRWVAYVLGPIGVTLLPLRFLIDDGEGAGGFPAYAAPVIAIALAPNIWLEAKRAQRWLDEHGQGETA
ncbi:hypothetical protein [Kineosporia sp. NBRC 101677]|uniref:hypothetical protein n=1 Tax=Kineosporia sp. NBRC 101677 TaxID=3032197 RepID=UPI0025535D9C|nr:hypothetical protein [Kineosporia sp. NBRC 101677]